MVGFRGTVENIHAESTIKLPLRDGEEGTGVIPFDQLVNQIDELKDGSRFYLNPLYWNGDLQTIGFSIADYSKVYQVYYGRRVLTLSDGATLSADYVLDKPDSIEKFQKLVETNHKEGWPKLHPRSRFLDDEEISQLPKDDTKPLLIINHGLGGGSHEPYCKAMAEGAYNKGFDVVVLHARGCGRSKISTPELFCGLVTDDLRYFLKVLRKEYPNRPFFGAGFSFGATILGNYLGEEGDKSEYVATALLSNPWDMVDSCYRLKGRYLSRLLFLKPITETLTRLVKSNRVELLKGDFFTEELVNKKYATVHEFDTNITAPLYGFNSALEYYRKASSVNKIFDIRTPTLIISSTDDPVVGTDSVPTYEAKVNPSLVLIKTDLGGHIAYVRPDGSLWAIDQISEFLDKFQKTVDTSKKATSEFVTSINRFNE